jgi:hypothetical protein
VVFALRKPAPRAAVQPLEQRIRLAIPFRPLLRGRSFRSAKTATGNGGANPPYSFHS